MSDIVFGGWSDTWRTDRPRLRLGPFSRYQTVTSDDILYLKFNHIPRLNMENKNCRFIKAKMSCHVFGTPVWFELSRIVTHLIFAVCVVGQTFQSNVSKKKPNIIATVRRHTVCATENDRKEWNEMTQRFYILCSSSPLSKSWNCLDLKLQHKFAHSNVITDDSLTQHNLVSVVI